MNGFQAAPITEHDTAIVNKLAGQINSNFHTNYSSFTINEAYHWKVSGTKHFYNLTTNTGAKISTLIF